MLKGKEKNKIDFLQHLIAEKTSSLLEWSETRRRHRRGHRLPWPRHGWWGNDAELAHAERGHSCRDRVVVMVKDKTKRRTGSNLLYVRVQDYAASHNVSDAEASCLHDHPCDAKPICCTLGVSRLWLSIFSACTATTAGKSVRPS